MHMYGIKFIWPDVFAADICCLKEGKAQKHLAVKLCCTKQRLVLHNCPKQILMIQLHSCILKRIIAGKLTKKIRHDAENKKDLIWSKEKQRSMLLRATVEIAVSYRFPELRFGWDGGERRLVGNWAYNPVQGAGGLLLAVATLEPHSSSSLEQSSLWTMHSMKHSLQGMKKFSFSTRTTFPVMRSGAH